MPDETTEFYSVAVIAGDEDEDSSSLIVGLVWAKNLIEAREKANALFIRVPIYEMKITKLSHSYLDKIKSSRGGGIIAKTEVSVGISTLV